MKTPQHPPLAKSVPGSESYRKIQRLLHGSLLSAVFIMSFYIFLKKFVPFTPVLKDLLLALVSFLSLLAIVTKLEKRWNILDYSTLSVFLFLIAEFIWTSFQSESLTATYYEFRVSYFPIVLFFGFRQLDRREELYNYCLGILWLACTMTIIESTLLNLKLMGPTAFGRIASVPDNVFDLDLGGILKRVVGIAGTPHITGVVNLALFAYWAPRLEKNANKLIWILTIVSGVSVILSTSRTAWSSMLLIVGLLLLKSFYAKRVLGRAVLALLLCLPFALELVTKLRISPVLENYFTFLDIYKDLLAGLIKPALDKNPLFGLGYDVGASAPMVLWNVQPMSTGITDIFIGQLFRYFGAVGWILILVCLFALPLKIFFGKGDDRQRGAALSVISIFLCFSHYSPLTQPVAALMLWMFLALAAGDFDREVPKSLQPL